MDEFSSKHSGAKSNNLKNLRGKLDENIKLPESVVIPFQVLEYTLSLYPETEKQVQYLISKVTTVTTSQAMNIILDSCKEEIMSLEFNAKDKHHAFLKE